LRGVVRRRGVPDILGMRADMGRGGLGEQALERREGGRGRFLFGVPLSERVKLQKFVQKCSKW
jgi:hypothetical protein